MGKTHEERLENIHRRLTPPVEARIREAISKGELPRPLQELTASGGDGQLESMMPLGALERIVRQYGRPPLLVKNNQVILEDLVDFPPDTPAKIKAVECWLPSVGRIEFVNHAMQWGGTGWVCDRVNGKWLIMTNRHVAALVAQRKNDGSAVFLRTPSGARCGALIDFLEEVDSQANNSRTAVLNSISYLADDTSADVALLQVDAALFDMPDPLVLSERSVTEGELVALIGYPAYDSRYNKEDQARYYRDLYEVKRFAPGKIMQGGDVGEVLSHDCTSLGGNSGSPLISLEDGRVVGLHFTGRYGEGNGAVSSATLAKLLRGERPPYMNIPLQINEAPDGHHPASHFRGREGFVQLFLQDGSTATPWPKLSDDLETTLAQPNDDPPEKGELRYMHFGVKYSAKWKLPLITAVNIDGRHSVRIKRGDDKWFTDGRIPLDIQLGARNFADAQIDRGHMVRREDPNWEISAGDAELANDDTFHYVNAVAQHSTLNQGKALWLGLESYILDSSRTHGFRACVFTGPVMRDKDEEEEVIIDNAVVPREFWKLVVTLDETEKTLHATAYLLSQGELVRKLLEKRSRRESLEGFVLGAYRTFQLSVADLAEATGYDFSAYSGADPLRKQEAAISAFALGEPVILPILHLADIRL
ncbi:MAG: DNA/RNA non-specific endonuclease [Niveispirillum sp.]|uniref:DNA/RNA non-specific endonuclease n=1 Tax=Asticcacaulis sp. TaxID=1872648 RepID=UPI001A27E306|nr:DNA/RNA non-specific endonuclease [Asticcacaulis sp.]MBJ7415829.1 DNA/RNA non-specific endonuclease [Niveispirillum sp.]